MGIPIVAGALLIVRAEQIDYFIILLYEVLAIFGYIAAILDVKTKRIPNSLILAMLFAWVSVMTPKLFIDTDAAIVLLMESALGFAIGGGLFLLVYLVSRQGLGGGDVKFMAAVGLYLRISGILSAIFCVTVLASLVGLILILLKKIGRKDTIPLAPFLYAGILTAIFFL